MASKNKIITWGMVLMSVGLLSSCGTATANQTGQQTVKAMGAETTTTADQFFKQLTAKVPEDASTRDQGRVTYSQFYQRGSHWYWHLTSANKIIAQGKVRGLTSPDRLTKVMTLVDGKTTYTLTLRWFDQLKNGYELISAHHAIKGDYVLCDAQVAGAWTRGVPEQLKGTWQTELYKNPVADKQYPYQKTSYTLDADQQTGRTDSYEPNKKASTAGSDWHANNLQYKQLSANTYMLKAYNGTPNLTKVHVADNQLTINYQATGEQAIPAMHRVN